VARHVSAPGDGTFANDVGREVKHTPPEEYIRLNC
jgi:hypothetical protein